MNRSFVKFLLLTSALLSGSLLQAKDAIESGDWKVTLSDDTHKLNISHRGKDILKEAYAKLTFNFEGDSQTFSITTGDATPSVEIQTVDDEFGAGRSLVITTAKDGGVMTQRLNFYDNHPYIITSVEISGANGEIVQSNDMTALATDSRTNPFNGSNNRFIEVPYDNDGHGRYHNTRISTDGLMSNEVTAIYDAESRRGLVAGSVDHDKWKSGVIFYSYGKGYGLQHLSLFSGKADWSTRDVAPHGKVKGATVESARFMFGIFDDWREGLETYADANTLVVPPLEWNGGNPMGWSTWGVMMNYVNYDGVVETAQWIKENLQPLGFIDRNGRNIISLDSFAEDNMGTRISTLGNKVLSEGEYRIGRDTYQGLNMDLGLYGGPFVLWGWVVDSTIPGTGVGAEPSYTWSQAALRHDGELIKVNSNQAYALDPTHPAIETHIKWAFKKYASYGARYVKVDFLNNGQCEGDSWYNPEITTGTMAYNYGMKIMREEAEKYGMYIVESIAPIFPYQYAHGRRQTCDRFSEIAESEYVMNAISYGWWTDRLYAVNDPDQLVLCKAGHEAAETMGENRARATTGMTSGAYIFGDNLASPGVVTHDGADVGYPLESRKRALEIMGNPDINKYVRENMGSFRPIEGGSPTGSTGGTAGQESESLFMKDTEEYLYVAVYNFAKGTFAKEQTGEIEFSRIGIDPAEVGTIKELWTGEEIVPGEKSFSYNVPKADARVYRISKGSFGAVDGVEAELSAAWVKAFVISTGACRVCASSEISSVRLYDINGALLGEKLNVADSNTTLEAPVLPGSVVIVECVLADGTRLSAKTVK
ncbi:MAG: hypothetical protein HDS35_12420 [Bacteroides sp.]|nr:hypothetical protein [Bacteroides sp.]